MFSLAYLAATSPGALLYDSSSGAMIIAPEHRGRAATEAAGEAARAADPVSVPAGPWTSPL